MRDGHAAATGNQTPRAAVRRKANLASSTSTTPKCGTASPVAAAVGISADEQNLAGPDRGNYLPAAPAT